MKDNIDRIEDELEKLGYTIEGSPNYKMIGVAFERSKDEWFWYMVEALQAHGDNQIMENFAEFLHDNKWVVKNE